MLIIFGTHNLQTFEHDTLINKLLLMQFYLVIFARNRIIESDENYASKLPVNMTTVLNFLDFTINAVLRPTFIRKLYYKLSSILAFTFIQIFEQNFVFFTEWRQSCRACLIQRQNWRYFWFPVLKTKSS